MNKRRIQTFLIISLLTSLLSCSAGMLRDETAIEKFLTRNNYDFLIDEEGDFRLKISLDDQTENTVWIRSKLNYSGDSPVREIFSVAAILDSEQCEYISRFLLQDNLQTRVMGSWAFMKDEGDERVILIYLLKLPLSTGNDYLIDALSEAVLAAEVMNSVIQQSD